MCVCVCVCVCVWKFKRRNIFMAFCKINVISYYIFGSNCAGTLHIFQTT